MPPLYPYNNRFTPSIKEVEKAEKVIAANIKDIIAAGGHFRQKKYLKNKRSLKNYRKGYVGGIDENGDKIISVYLTHTSLNGILEFSNALYCYYASSIVWNQGDAFLIIDVNMHNGTIHKISYF